MSVLGFLSKLRDTSAARVLHSSWKRYRSVPPVDATRGSTRRFYQEGGLAIVFFLLPPEEYHPLATYSSVVRKTPWMRGEFRVAWTTAAIRRSVELYVHSAHEQTSRSLVLRRVRSGRPSSEDIARGIAESNGACDEER